MMLRLGHEQPVSKSGHLLGVYSYRALSLLGDGPASSASPSTAFAFGFALAFAVCPLLFQLLLLDRFAVAVLEGKR
jgi:hypothetical protein